MNELWVPNTNSRCGSKITMSASAPGAIVPFWGYSPNSFATELEVSSTSRLGVRRPVRTPCSQSIVRRCWMTASPFGIFEKSPSPSRFCSSVNGQWSVETICRWSKRERVPERLLVGGRAQRRRADVARTLEVGTAQVVLGQEQVLQARLAVTPARLAHVPR